MASKTPRRQTGRRSKWAAAALIGIGLLVTGGIYAGATAAMASAQPTTTTSSLTADDGKKLFQANCATCHGMSLQGTADGPSLYGVGALAVEFQVSTGRMPLQAQGPQAPQKPAQFTEDQILAMSEWVQSQAPGPTFPDPKVLDGQGNVANGAELFRMNCAMCHNVAAAGGALTQGKYAPALTSTSALHMYAAMTTGPQNMPVFNDMTLTTEEKRDIISSLLFLQQNESAGGFSLGSLGPVSEGLFIWIFGIGALIGLTVWITAKSN